MLSRGIQRLPSTLWQSLADAGHVTLDLPVEFFPAKLGKSPVLWSRDEVLLWVEWCSHEFALSNVNVTKFDMNGKALCLLAKGDFFDRVPDVGDVLYNTLRTLLHKPYNHVSRGDDATLAGREYTPLRPWRRLSGDHDDGGYRGRRRSSGHECDVCDREGGELHETLYPVQRDGQANHYMNGDVGHKNSVHVEESAHIRQNGRNVAVDDDCAAQRRENTTHQHIDKTVTAALDLSQTPRPSNGSPEVSDDHRRENIHRDDEALNEKDASFRQWTQDPRWCRPPSRPLSSSPKLLPPHHTKVESSTTTPSRSFPEVLVAYMTTPIESIAMNGDVKPDTPAGQTAFSEVPNHQPVGCHMTIGDVSVGTGPDAAGRFIDLHHPVHAPRLFKEQPQNNAYCIAVKEGIACRTDTNTPVRIRDSDNLPSNGILEQGDIAEPLQENDMHAPDRKDGRLLWEFLNDLLVDGQHRNVIRWEDRQTRTFIIIDPAGLATLWGEHKRRPHMTYEKMSRAMRYYYDMHIIRRVPGRRLTYSFMQEPCDIKRGVRGAKRGVPHVRRQCRSERPIAAKVARTAANVVPIATTVSTNDAQNDEHKVQLNGTERVVNGEKKSEEAVSPTPIPRRDHLCSGDSLSSWDAAGAQLRGHTQFTDINDDGRSEVSRLPGQLKRNGNQGNDSQDAMRTRRDSRKNETDASPSDIRVVDNRAASDSYNGMSPGNTTHHRSSPSST